MSTDVFGVAIASGAHAYHPEYKRLKTQYYAIFVIVKRCQDIVRKQQEEKAELTKKLKAAEESLTAAKEVKDLDLDASVGTVWRRDV